MIGKTVTVALGTVMAGLLADVAPLMGAATVFVGVDVVTAMGLQRRLRRQGHAVRTGLSSERLGHTVRTLAGILLALVLAWIVDATVLGGTRGPACQRLVAGAVTVWQAASILENLSAANGARWAGIARRMLIDKAKRYF